MMSAITAHNNVFISSCKARTSNATSPEACTDATSYEVSSLAINTTPGTYCISFEFKGR